MMAFNYIFMAAEVNSQSFLNIAQELSSSIYEASGKLLNVATFVAAVIAVFNLVIITGKIMSGDKVGLMGLFKPFVLLVVISGFYAIVVAPVNYITGAVTSSVNAVSKMSSEVSAASLSSAVNTFETALSGFHKKWEDQMKLKEETTEGESLPNIDAAGGSSLAKDSVALARNEDPVTRQVLKECLDDMKKDWSPFGTRVASRVMNFSKDFFGVMAQSGMALVVSFMNMILPMACTAYICFSILYLAILSLLGPFCFAFSMIPGIQSNPMSWVGRYIEVSMWQPLVALVYMVYTKYIEKLNLDRYKDMLVVYEGGNSGTKIMTDANFSELTTALYSVVLVSIVCLILLKNVKSMASVVMNAGGMGGMSVGGSMLGGLRKTIGI